MKQLAKKKLNLSNSIYALSIRHGLTLAIPFLIMGSFALLINNFPIAAYQEFISACFGGALSQLLATLYDISLGSLALILIITISFSFGKLAGSEDAYFYPLAALTSYLAFCGGVWEQEDYIFNAEWVFTSMCITLLSCFLLRKGMELLHSLEKLHTAGADYQFNLAIQSLFPIVLISVLFGILGYLLRQTWGNSNVTNFGSYIFLRIFSRTEGSLFGTLLYVFVTHILWFLGIHGTNTLEAVSQRLFEPGIEVNQALLMAGKVPTEIYSKTFLDTFVFLGGCGCALSLVFALCICAKKSHNRRLGIVALPSALFNISEIAVFGFPIVFNLTMLIPFLLTPLLLVLTSTAAVKLGLVPMVTQSVGWTVPILLSGYQATGSMAGSILQVLNVILGILIYIPFVKRSERLQAAEFQEAVRHMEQDMEQGERTGIIPRYLEHSYAYNYYAKTLAMDLKSALQRGKIQLFYQAQIKSGPTLHGAEALLRWKHPVAGYIAPPVLIQLAYESGILDELGYYLIEKACTDIENLLPMDAEPFCLSVNISPKQLEDAAFPQKVMEIAGRCCPEQLHLVLEITERTVLETSDLLMQTIHLLQENGIAFSMDDFGMGHTSMLRLQENLFEEVKLDGNLVSQLLTNQRSREIISGIIQMSHTLNCRVIAEFVETKAQQDILNQLGCTLYQGYYYSRPLNPADFQTYLEEESWKSA